MVEILGKYYYVDIDAITEKCKTGETVTEEDGHETTEINIFKYEIIKLMIDRLFDEFDDKEDDDVLSSIKGAKTSISFDIAFNSLYQYGLIKEEN